MANRQNVQRVRQLRGHYSKDPQKAAQQRQTDLVAAIQQASLDSLLNGGPGIPHLDLQHVIHGAEPEKPKAEHSDKDKEPKDEKPEGKHGKDGEK